MTDSDKAKIAKAVKKLDHIAFALADLGEHNLRLAVLVIQEDLRG
jgi:hypothetical protein